MTRNSICTLLAFSLVAGVVSFAPAVAEAQDGDLYLACNLWYENPERLWSTGYQKGALLPAGTKVTNVEVKKKWTKKYIMFVDADSGTQYGMLWIPSHRPGVSIDEMRLRLFSEKNFDQLTAGFTAAEKAAIKAGKVEKGMSKDAVLVSIGYPPETGTTSLNSEVWKYWKDRFNTMDVRFVGTKVSTITD